MRVLFSSAPGRFHDPDVLQDRGVVTALDETVEFIFSPIEGSHLLPERRLGLLEDLLETGALCGGQAEFTLEPLVLPPLAALSQGRSDAKGQQQGRGRAAVDDS